MSITFHPATGTLLMCDFNTGFAPPEMVKKRPVVVVSRGRTQIATVVPLSTVEPIPFEAYHYEMSPRSLPKSLRGRRCWATCDMVVSVALWRLDRILDGKCPKTGKRQFVAPLISNLDLEHIRKALRARLAL